MCPCMCLYIYVCLHAALWINDACLVLLTTVLVAEAKGQWIHFPPSIFNSGHGWTFSKRFNDRFFAVIQPESSQFPFLSRFFFFLPWTLPHRMWAQMTCPESCSFLSLTVARNSLFVPISSSTNWFNDHSSWSSELFGFGNFTCC